MILWHLLGLLIDVAVACIKLGGSFYCAWVYFFGGGSLDLRALTYWMIFALAADGVRFRFTGGRKG